jgi:hypothetical protein
MSAVDVRSCRAATCAPVRCTQDGHRWGTPYVENVRPPQVAFAPNALHISYLFNASQPLASTRQLCASQRQQTSLSTPNVQAQKSHTCQATPAPSLHAQAVHGRTTCCIIGARSHVKWTIGKLGVPAFPRMRHGICHPAGWSLVWSISSPLYIVYFLGSLETLSLSL